MGLVSSYDVFFLQFKGCSRLEGLFLIPILRNGTERADVAVKDLTQDCHYTTQYRGGKQYSRWNMEQFHTYYHVQNANWRNGELNTVDTYGRADGHNMGNHSDKGLPTVHKGLLS
jgi:hypothetical protein